MTSPPIFAVLEWHARQFFCKRGATCESKPAVSAAIAPDGMPDANPKTTKRRRAFIRGREFQGAYRILVVKHELLTGQQRPRHVAQRSLTRIIHPGGLLLLRRCQGFDQR